MRHSLLRLCGDGRGPRSIALTAAFTNLAELEELTRRDDDLCRHHGMRASRNNLSESHKNGAIESRQGSLKVALEQALLLRGSRELADLSAYEQFIAETVRRFNDRCARACGVNGPASNPCQHHHRPRCTCDLNALPVNSAGCVAVASAAQPAAALQYLTPRRGPARPTGRYSGGGRVGSLAGGHRGADL